MSQTPNNNVVDPAQRSAASSFLEDAGLWEPAAPVTAPQSHYPGQQGQEIVLPQTMSMSPSPAPQAPPVQHTTPYTPQHGGGYGGAHQTGFQRPVQVDVPPWEQPAMPTATAPGVAQPAASEQPMSYRDAYHAQLQNKAVNASTAISEQLNERRQAIGIPFTAKLAFAGGVMQLLLRVIWLFIVSAALGGFAFFFIGRTVIRGAIFGHLVYRFGTRDSNASLWLGIVSIIGIVLDLGAILTVGHPGLVLIAVLSLVSELAMVVGAFAPQTQKWLES